MDIVGELFEVVIDDFDVVFVGLSSLSEPVDEPYAEVDSRRFRLYSTKHVLEME